MKMKDKVKAVRKNNHIIDVRLKKLYEEEDKNNKWYKICEARKKEGVIEIIHRHNGMIVYKELIKMEEFKYDKSFKCLCGKPVKSLNVFSRKEKVEKADDKIICLGPNCVEYFVTKHLSKRNNNKNKGERRENNQIYQVEENQRMGCYIDGIDREKQNLFMYIMDNYKNVFKMKKEGAYFKDGKYKGKSLDSVYQKSPDYIKFIFNKLDIKKFKYSWVVDRFLFTYGTYKFQMENTKYYGKDIRNLLEETKKLNNIQTAKCATYLYWYFNNI